MIRPLVSPSPVDLTGVQNKITANTMHLAGLPQTSDAAAGFGNMAKVANQSCRVKQRQSVILFGDSFSDAQKTTNASFLNSALQISCWRFVLGRLGKAVRVARYAGLSGNTAQMMLARVDTDVTPYSADWVFMQCGANDFWGFAYTADKVFSDVQQILTKLTGAGYKVLLCASPPQTPLRANFTANMNLHAQIYNQRMADYCAGLDSVLFVDIYSPMLDWEDTTTSRGLARFFGNDGIHLSNYGALAWANAVMAKIAPYIAPDTGGSVFPQAAGILGTRSIMASTGGTATGNVTGSVSAGWNVQRASGTNGSGVVSKLNGLLRVVFTLVPTNGPCTLRASCSGTVPFITPLTPFIGKKVAGRAKIRAYSSSGVSLRKLEAKITFVAVDTGLQQVSNGTAYSGYPVAEDFAFDTGEMVLEIAEQTVPDMTTSSSNGLFIEIDADSVAGGSYTLDIYSFEVYEVPSP